MSTREAESILHNLEIDTKKPIITQISRYDHWKDPEGVVKIYEQVKKKANCQLVLLGNTATDDPEGVEVFGSLREKYDKKKDIKLLVNVENNDLVVNALQRSASVVIQKSTREGFALTVSEALYKGTPVVASNIGGIPLQITHGHNGYLHDPLDYKSFGESIISLLKDDKIREGMGQNAHQFAKENFLITRLMNDWLDMFKKYM
jgi:trehalose synthase